MSNLKMLEAHLQRVNDLSQVEWNVDDEALARSQAEADVFNNAFNPVSDELVGMTSFEAKNYLEEKYKPLLTAAINAHKSACDEVSRLEDNADGKKAAWRGEYAASLRHPEIKRVTVAGAEHLSHLVRSGAINIEGFKLVDSSALNMNLGAVSNTRMTLVYIPQGRDSLMSYADTEEARDYAEREYRYKLSRLISSRKRAAMKLEALRNEVAEKWSGIQDFESMFASTIRKGRK